ncbi:hypothetical protein RHMOL_Rhmol01G0319500 [Rhododendron molle]|uniref:Uncharacterized protein n=1 Tax=Rhododendron molle TaxID=49168 RepID=A0ACC0QB86_RHOML|nr:hypothetical protein RHMOL_Rhmol01G0319500 [Rhododendron molle]
MLHKQRERHLLLDPVAGNRHQPVLQQHGGSHRLHLQVSQVLPQTSPRTGIERHELVPVHGRLEPVSFARQPPLRFKLQAILPPYGFHPPHRIYRVRHRRPRRHVGPVRQNIVGDDILEILRHRRVQPQCLGQCGF